MSEHSCHNPRFSNGLVLFGIILFALGICNAQVKNDVIDDKCGCKASLQDAIYQDRWEYGKDPTPLPDMRYYVTHASYSDYLRSQLDRGSLENLFRGFGFNSRMTEVEFKSFQAHLQRKSTAPMGRYRSVKQLLDRYGDANVLYEWEECNNSCRRGLLRTSVELVNEHTMMLLIYRELSSSDEAGRIVNGTVTGATVAESGSSQLFTRGYLLTRGQTSKLITRKNPATSVTIRITTGREKLFQYVPPYTPPANETLHVSAPHWDASRDTKLSAFTFGRFSGPADVNMGRIVLNPKETVPIDTDLLYFADDFDISITPTGNETWPYPYVDKRNLSGKAGSLIPGDMDRLTNRATRPLNIVEITIKPADVARMLKRRNTGVPPQLMESVKSDLEALRNVAALVSSGTNLPDGGQRRDIWAAEDLNVKSGYLNLRTYVAGPAHAPQDGLINVTVRTRTANGDDVNGYEVWYAPFAWQDISSHWARFDTLSTPTTKIVPAGRYSMWTRRDGKDGTRTPVSPGDDGRQEKSVDLPVQ